MKGAGTFYSDFRQGGEVPASQVAGALLDGGCVRQTWVGESDRSYEYLALPLQVVLENVGGNYIVCDQDSGGDWSPLLIGETSRLCDLFRDLAVLSWLRGYGAISLHVRINSCCAERRAEKLDLVKRHCPPLQSRRWLRT